MLGRYSKWAYWANMTQRLGDTAPRHDSETQGELRSIVRKLQPYQVRALQTDYKAGATVYELATRYKISRQTVSLHLHRLGIQMRRQGLAEQQVIDGARLYEQGWSCARIARHYDVTPGTVWLRLRDIGVQMRDPHGRDSATSWIWELDLYHTQPG
jgi:hypothetical protein